MAADYIRLFSLARFSDMVDRLPAIAESAAAPRALISENVWAALALVPVRRETATVHISAGTPEIALGALHYVLWAWRRSHRARLDALREQAPRIRRQEPRRGVKVQEDGRAVSSAL